MKTNTREAARLSANRVVYPWVICMVGMLFYCFNYFLRVSPSVMQDELIQGFHITAYQFGALAGFYYYAYTPMQLPAGLIYDKFGARPVLFFACLTAVLGLATFVSANSYAVAAIGRFMVGLGCAFAYIGVLKLASLWLPANRFATAAGLATAMAMTAGALSQKYLSKAVLLIGYKQSLHLAIFIGLALSVLIVLLVRSPPKHATKNNVIPLHNPINFKQFIRILRAIATNPQMWLIGIIGCLSYLPATVFLDLWGIPYFKSVYHLTAEQAVDVTGITFFGWIIAGPIIGALSDKIKRRRMPIMLTSGIAAALLAIVFYSSGVSLFWLHIVFFIVGFCCGAHPLCFALGKENNPLQFSGTAVAVTNMLIMLGGAIFQPVVGKLLDIHASGAIDAHGLPIYTPSDYTFALSVIPVGVAVALLLSFFLRETYCRSIAKESVEHRPIISSIRGGAEPKGAV
jgi:MFS family permease